MEIGHTHQLYCVYVNNLSRTMVESLTSGLEDYEPFAGYVDGSTSSAMKDWLSSTLVRSYLKASGIVVTLHEDDEPNTHDQNTQGWPWEENDYTVRSLQAMCFDHLLAYKIERRVLPGESDTEFALTAISGRPHPLGELPVAVEEAKAEYLNAEKAGGLDRAGLGQMSNDELAAVIRAKIADSYIYELRYRANLNESYFSIMLEVRHPETEVVTRLLARLEYQPGPPMLRLVTLY